MNKHQLKEHIINSHQDFVDELINLDWETSQNNKWSNSQHALHILKALELTNKAFAIPKIILSFKFGKANSPSRSYDEVCEKYITKLNANKGIAKKFNSKLRRPLLSEKEVILKQIIRNSKLLSKRIEKFSEEQLDKFVFPHPLLGKLTIRELLMWFGFHTKQHHNSVRKNI